MAHCVMPISQMHPAGVFDKMQMLEEKYRMACQVIDNLKSDVMNLENRSKATSESRFYEDKLACIEAKLEEREREVAWLCEENERLRMKQGAVEPVIGTRGDDDENKAKMAQEIQVLRYRVEHLTSAKDIVELKLDEARQENETLRKALSSANKPIPREDPDEDSAMSDVSSDLLGHDFISMSEIYELLENENPLTHLMKVAISVLLSKLQCERRHNDQLVKAARLQQQGEKSPLEACRCSRPNNPIESEVDSLLMERMRLSTALTTEEMKNSSLQQAFNAAQRKLLRTRNLDRELAELRRQNWDLECERMDLEFERNRVLRDAGHCVRLMKKALAAVDATMREWNRTGQPISPALGPEFYQSFEQIGFFLKYVKDYEEEAIKAESRAKEKREKTEAAGTTTPVSESSTGPPLPNQRYRKAYRNLKREYEDLSSEHDAMIERYQGIKSGLTSAMYQSAVNAVTAALHQGKQQRKMWRKKRKNNQQSEKPMKEKIARPQMLSCDEESF